MYKVSIKTSFAAAHRLREYEGACENLHGHNWSVLAQVGAEQLNHLGIAYDFKQLKQDVKSIVDRMDHQLLNDLEPFKTINPTSENVARHIFDSLQTKLPAHLKVLSVAVGESENYTATYEP